VSAAQRFAQRKALRSRIERRVQRFTAGYHRYFAHRSYKTSRWFQFVLAWVGASSVPRRAAVVGGPAPDHHLWSDTPRDIHSPKQRGFWYSPTWGWITAPDHDGTDLALIPDFAKYPELRSSTGSTGCPSAVLTAIGASPSTAGAAWCGALA
jgi:hypothetical protein